MVQGFIYPKTEIIKQSINCEACWIVRLSCCLDLDVLDAVSYDWYANHNHSFKVVGNFLHLRQEQQKHLYSSNYPVFWHLSAVSSQIFVLRCCLTWCVMYKCSKRRNSHPKFSFSSSFCWLYPGPKELELSEMKYWHFQKKGRISNCLVMAVCCGSLSFPWFSIITKPF